MAQKYTVSHDSSLLEYLFELFPDQSRTGVKSYLKNARVSVNGETNTSFDCPLRKGDRIEIMSKGASIGRDMKTGAKEQLLKQGIRIVYEDEHLIVIDKNAGVPTIAVRKSTADTKQKTAYSLLTDYMHTEKRAGIKDGTGNYRSPSRVFIVHRLDRETSGLLVFAKDEYTKNLMQSKWNETVIERKYEAVIEGRLPQKAGRMESWLSENEKSFKMSSSPIDNGGLHAVTHYRIIDENSRFSKVVFELETGRKNQIRVQAAEVLGHPIVGDRKYGSNLNFGGRIALHASILALRNPYGGQILRFESPLPQSFGRLIQAQ